MNDNAPWQRYRFRNIYEAIPNIEPGDLVARRKRGGIGEHWGVALPSGSLIERQFEYGVKVIGIADFATPNELVDVVKPHPQFRNLIEIYSRANQELSGGEPYDFFKKNCEHTATFVATGKASSGQIFVLFLVAGLSIGLYVMAKNQRAA